MMNNLRFSPSSGSGGHGDTQKLASYRPAKFPGSGELRLVSPYYLVGIDDERISVSPSAQA